MTDRVLTVEEVALLASLNETFLNGLPKADARALVLSHRLLQERVTELEALIPKRLIQRVGGTDTR